MPTYAVQFRRGTTIEHTTFIGSEGEITVNTDDSTLRLHDGETAGGFAFASAASILTDISQYTDEDGILLGTGTIASDVPSTVTNYAAYTKALVSTNAGGSAVEDKTGTHTLVNSGVTASNTAYKYATASMYFDGSSYLQIPAHEDLVFGVRQPFTLETWVYPTDSTNDTVLIAQDNGTSSGQGFRLTRKSTGVIEFLFWKGISRSSSDTLLSTGSVAENEWTHLAVSYDGQTVRLFVNGVEQHSKTPQPFLYSSNQHITFGSTTDGASTNKFIGYLEDVRMINGVSVYNADFTVPTTTLTYVATSSGSWYGSRAVISAANIDYYNISTPGSAVQIFGTGGRWYQSGLSNSTYGVFAGGNGSPPSSVIDYVTIAVTGNASSFGSLTVGREKLAAASNGSRGLFLGGKDNWVGTNIIDYITIDTPDNATDFGDLLTARHWGMAAGDSTNAIHIGGFGPGNTPEIYYVTFDTLGSCSDWGSVPSGLRATGGAVTNGERVVYSAGFITDRSDVIEYFTNTVGSSVSNFGNLTLARQHQAAVTDGTYATFNGGSQGAFPFEVNTIDYVTIATTGPATDFGDLTTQPQNPGAASGSPS